MHILNQMSLLIHLKHRLASNSHVLSMEQNENSDEFLFSEAN